MDIEANLKELRDLAVEVLEIEDNIDLNEGYSDEESGRLQEIAVRQAMLFQSMDEWISKKGFLPKNWHR